MVEKKINTPMKILNIVLAVVFTLFAVVQLNDPDPYLWVAIYLAVAVISGFAVFQKYSLPGIIVLMIICLGGSIYYFPGLVELFSDHEIGDLTKTMKAEKPFIEESRESLGLLLSFLVLSFQYFQAVKLKKLSDGRQT